jgi:dienelactone hydrolase
VLPFLLALVAATAVSCGSKSSSRQPADGIPRLGFSYDTAAPLAFQNRGRINSSTYPIAIDAVSFLSGGTRVYGYLLVPPGSGKRPAVVFGPGAGGDRTELLTQAAWLAARNVVTLTLTPPSSTVTTTPTTAAGLIAQARQVTVDDVIAVRRAVDLLQSLRSVDADRIGYLGWSLGAKTGTFVAASDPRVKALVLLSAGADELSAFVAHAPRAVRSKARRVLGSVDPIRYVAWAKPGSLLLEDGSKDEVVPHAALLNVTRAAPHGTDVRWYGAGHALNGVAYRDAFEWLAKKLSISGPRIRGAAAGP